MPLKLNEKNNAFQALSENFWVQSGLLHTAIVLSLLALSWISNLQRSTQPDRYEFEVVRPVTPENTPLVKETKPQEIQAINQPSANSKGKAVFGLNRNALVALDGADSAAEVKSGNTLAKEQDNETLNANDPDRVGVKPVDEFLVSKMPVLKNEFRVPYPPISRAKGIQGPVVLDLVIGADGKVKSAKVIDEPNAELGAAALAASQNIEFEPARMGAEAVPVRIRYIYRFILE